jgi:hypothetical protein
LPLRRERGCRLDLRPRRSDGHLLLIHTPPAVEISVVHLALQ